MLRVCLITLFVGLEKILLTKKNQKNIRFSPHTGYVPNEAQEKNGNILSLLSD